MKTLVVFAVLLVVAYGQLRCVTPPQWYGYVHETHYTVAEQGREERVGVEYRHTRVDYDYTGKRLRIREFIDLNSPFPGPDGPPARDIERDELYLFNTRKSYVVEHDRCTENDMPVSATFEPFGPPKDVTHRGQTYIGGNASSIHRSGVLTDVYTTPHTVTSRHYHGNWALYQKTYCVPVTESFFNSTGSVPRPGAREMAIHGHTTFYNITGGIANSTIFRVPDSCTHRIL